MLHITSFTPHIHKVTEVTGRCDALMTRKIYLLLISYVWIYCPVPCAIALTTSFLNVEFKHLSGLLCIKPRSNKINTLCQGTLCPETGICTSKGYRQVVRSDEMTVDIVKLSDRLPSIIKGGCFFQPQDSSPMFQGIWVNHGNHFWTTSCLGLRRRRKIILACLQQSLSVTNYNKIFLTIF